MESVLLKGNLENEAVIKSSIERPIFIIYPTDQELQGSLNPPLGLAYISASLKKNGYKPSVLDLTFDKEMEQVKQIQANNGIYILSFALTLVDKVKKVIEIIRSKDKTAFILAGGPLPTAQREKILEDFAIDLVAIGECELRVVDIIDAIQKNSDLSKIKGIIFRENGKIVITEPADYIQNLDEIPIPDQAAFPIEEYFKQKRFRELSIITSRGCPYRCTYCQPILNKLFGPKVRFNSPNRIVDEMEYLVKNFKLDMVVFFDDTFAFYQDRVIEICKEMVKRKIPVLWRCQTRAGLRKDVIEWMKKAGCFLICFGVESCSQKILDNVHKDITVKEIKNTFKYCKESGILTHAYMMVGNLGESDETINETIQAMKEIRPFGYNVTVTTPMPGSYLHEYAIKNNLLIKKDLSKYNYIIDGCKVAKLTEFDPEELPKKKAYLEKAISKESEKVRDIIRLFADKNFIKRIISILIFNPGFIVRITKLGIRGFLARGKGFAIVNPKSKA